MDIENRPENSNVMESAPQPRKRLSLAAGESRRDRFQRFRQGTGRAPTVRAIGIIGRKTGLTLENVKKDYNGFDDLDDIFGLSSDEESTYTNATLNNTFEEETPLKQSRSIFKNTDTSPFPGTVFTPLGASSTAPSPAVSPVPVNTPAPPQFDDQDGMFELNDGYSSDDMGGVGMDFNDDYGSDIEQDDETVKETQSEQKAKKQKKIKAKKAKKTGSGSSKRSGRRRTLLIIRQARKAGVLEDIEEEALEEDQAGLRRSRRVKFKPLKYWKNERVIYERKPTGLSAVLPTVKLDEPLTAAIGDPTPKSFKKRSRTKSSRKKKNKKKRKVQHDSDDEAEEVKKEPLNPICWVVDKSSENEVSQKVANRESMVVMDALPQETSDGPVAPELCPRGGKTFESSNFCTGVLLLPPGASKPREMALSSEIFLVHSCSPNGLHAQIHNTDFVFSKGDSFVVPVNNTYTLHNASQKDIKLHFTLVKE